jgi:hypothetical protein
MVVRRGMTAIPVFGSLIPVERGGASLMVALYSSMQGALLFLLVSMMGKASLSSCS